MSKRSVLLTCAGLRVDVVRAFREALDGLGWDGEVVAVDANPLAPALVKADRGVVVPHASSPDYIPALAELVSAHGVRAVPSFIESAEEVLGWVSFRALVPARARLRAARRAGRAMPVAGS